MQKQQRVHFVAVLVQNNFPLYRSRQIWVVLELFVTLQNKKLKHKRTELLGICFVYWSFISKTKYLKHI